MGERGLFVVIDVELSVGVGGASSLESNGYEGLAKDVGENILAEGSICWVSVLALLILLRTPAVMYIPSLKISFTTSHE